MGRNRLLPFSLLPVSLLPVLAQGVLAAVALPTPPVVSALPLPQERVRLAQLESSPPAELPMLRFGSRGQAVVVLELVMGELGIRGLVVDGVFDRPLEDAVLAFQRRNGLPASGVVDAATWSALLRLWRAR